jgi:hypothetical protein
MDDTKPTTASILIKHIEEEQGWRLQWRDTLEPADERLFASLEAAGRVARSLMGFPDPPPKLALVELPDPTGGD